MFDIDQGISWWFWSHAGVVVALEKFGGELGFVLAPIDMTRLAIVMRGHQERSHLGRSIHIVALERHV